MLYVIFSNVFSEADAIHEFFLWCTTVTNRHLVFISPYGCTMYCGTYLTAPVSLPLGLHSIKPLREDTIDFGISCTGFFGLSELSRLFCIFVCIALKRVTYRNLVFRRYPSKLSPVKMMILFQALK